LRAGKDGNLTFEQLNRREFIGALAGTAVTPLPVAAQPGNRLPRIALVLIAVSSGEITGPDPRFAPARAFVEELRDLGWINGRTATIELRSLEGDPQRAPTVFAELLARGVEVIALGGARWLQDAALKATATIPIITLFQDDPVASGLIASLARPGGNLTGIAQTTGPELFNKRLALLKEIAPDISRAAFLAPRGVLEQDRGLARPAGVTLVPIEVDVEEQLPVAFATVMHERADALMVAGSAVTYAGVPRIVAFASESKLPAMYPFREAVDAGGLMSYATSIPQIFRQMARLCDRVLKGAKPADLPAEQPTKFELVINLKVAKALGLSVPLIMQMTADEVVE
jgi:putative tryptophan/tyrosine transport system substrate-binding protein